VGFFATPILASHDTSTFHVYCYFNHSSSDAASRQLFGYGHTWRFVAGMSDHDAAEQIRTDQIDILVDLNGHTNGTRLGIFARQPAPLQVTYVGYPNTTGLPTIQYRVTDTFADPPGTTEHLHSEELLRPFPSFLCYAPPSQTPKVTDLPALSAGTLTFGSFNQLRKIGPHTIRLWAAALRAVPGSRLIVKAATLTADAPCRERLLQDFIAAGIAPERITVLERQPRLADHFGLYGTIDVSLDTFPYHGTTTTCESLWMGVPVITLAGVAHRSRVGVSLLSNVGLSQLIARSEGEYGEIAALLSADIASLAAVRKGLRERMKRSPLMDPVGLTRAVESAYRLIWKRWCANRS
jgi:predicted O-linked N-acetylglucosamine transferase (SPINDLY family)